ncbi:hypothetical protein HZC00_05390 [Candidatus Kaiserbacteria bacterium]|nr:hypothetical protein [Candidatus Kaiserbacteria bacterium]
MMDKKVQILSIEYHWEQRLLRVLLGILFILTLSYLYFVAASVMNVIAHKEADVRSTALETSTGLLERQYFALSQEITPESGGTLGLSKISDQSYVYRPGNIGAATIASIQGAI